MDTVRNEERVQRPISRRGLIAASIGLSSVLGVGLAPWLGTANAVATTQVLTFEGIQDFEQILNYYNGGTGSLGSAGPNYGISFSPEALALIDADAGGSGNTANEPSGDASAVFVDGAGVVMNVAAGFTDGISFYYSFFGNASVTVYDGENATGTVLATVPLAENYNHNNCTGDPTGSFCNWDPVGVTFAGVAKSVSFGGAANRGVFDNITLGAEIPVIEPTDTTPPVVSNPGDQVIEATSAQGASFDFPAVTATDDVDGDIDASCAAPDGLASGATFPIGATTVTCSATDAAGNLGSSSYTVTVQDTTAPVLVVPDSFAVDATSPAGAAVSYAATATDLVDGDVTPVCSPSSGSTFAVGTTAVTCSAIDSRNNAAPDGSFTVHVRSAAEQITALEASLAALPSAQTQLQSALKKAAAGDVKTAQNMLRAAQNHVQAQSGKKLTTAEADAAVADIDRIISAIG